jgi:hypothetical protein
VPVAALDKNIIAAKRGNFILRDGFDGFVENEPSGLRADDPYPTHVQPDIGEHFPQRDEFPNPGITAMEKHETGFAIFHQQRNQVHGICILQIVIAAF